MSAYVFYIRENTRSCKNSGDFKKVAYAWRTMTDEEKKVTLFFYKIKLFYTKVSFELSKTLFFSSLNQRTLINYSNRINN